MTTLKLSGLQDDTPVKLSVELPAETHRDLVLYAQMLSSDAERPYSPAQLIAPMLSRFMATDRPFVASRARLGRSSMSR
nr:DUF2274 domain-containing protein [uncultured Brevundimonas sp.]